MNFEVLNSELRLSRGLVMIQGHRTGEMEGRMRRAPIAGGRRRAGAPLAGGQRVELKRPPSHGSSWRSFPTSYFSLEAFLVLVCLAASLLILPLVLPPLPPPPIMLLLVPVGILVLLMILAFMPSDIRNIASSYL